MAEERRDRVPPEIRDKLFFWSWFFDILRIILGGVIFIFGFALWVIGFATIIGSVITVPLGIGLQLMGGIISMLLSSVAMGVLAWIYHEQKINLMDRGGAILWNKIIFYLLSFIPFLPWNTISVALVIRAVQKEDREYNASKGL